MRNGPSSTPPSRYTPAAAIRTRRPTPLLELLTEHGIERDGGQIHPGTGLPSRRGCTGCGAKSHQPACTSPSSACPSCWRSSPARAARASTTFGEAALKDPELLALCDRVEMVVDAAIERDYPQRWRAAIDLETTDGRQFSKHIDHPRGDPQNPVSQKRAGEQARTPGALWKTPRTRAGAALCRLCLVVGASLADGATVHSRARPKPRQRRVPEHLVPGYISPLVKRRGTPRKSSTGIASRDRRPPKAYVDSSHSASTCRGKRETPRGATDARTKRSP